MVPVRRHARNWLAYIALGGLVLGVGLKPGAGIEPGADASAPAGNPPEHRAENTKEHQDQPQTGDKIAPQAAISTPDQTKPTQQTSAPASNKHDDESGPKVTDTVLAVSAVVSLFFNGALWLSTRNLWVETKRLAAGAETQTKDMKKSIAQATRAAKAMEDVATFTDRLVSGNSLSAQRQLRAYVMVHTARLENVEIGKTPSASIEVRNYGQTPAYDVRHRVEVVFSKFPPKTDVPMLNTSEHEPKMLIGPGGHINAIKSLGPVVAHNHLAALQNMTYAIFVVGTISYRDAFNESRITHYLYFANGHHSKGILAPYSTGNDAT